MKGQSQALGPSPSTVRGVGFRRVAGLCLVATMSLPAAEHLLEMARYRTPLRSTVEVPARAAYPSANPYANAVQLAYPELGVARCGSDPALFAELAAVLRSLHVRLLRFPGGTWCHVYSPYGPATMDALRAVRDDYIAV